jgi:2-methylcitrate dehydratase PrpD
VVEVETVSGGRLAERRHGRKGDPDDPLSDQELIEKFRELSQPVIGRAASWALLTALEEVDALADMADLPFAPPRPAAA